MTDSKNLFTRRAFFLGGVKGLLTAGIVGRLYWLQVKSKDHYKTLSDNNRLHGEYILPVRSQIFDEKGRLLAGNQFVHRAVLQRDRLKLWQDSLRKAGNLLDFTEEEIEELIEESLKKNRLIPITLKDPLDWDEVAKLELHLNDLPGIRVEQGHQRFYPYAQECCHVLGYVGKVSEKDLENSEDMDFLQLPGIRIGKSGMEKNLESTLRGEPGYREVEVNAHRQVVRELSSYSPENGPDLKTSLNLDLQKSCYERLMPFQSAAAVVMDIKTGGIKAAVSVPAYDVNYFTSTIPKKIWQELQENPHHPLLGKFFQGQYAPGSTFKMIIALAGLEKNVINPDTTFFCPGHFELNNHTFHCWENKNGHGNVTLQQAIAKSCDVYFYHLALLLGVDAMAEMAETLGLGQKTSLDFLGEKAGLIPTKSWKERLFRKKWTPAETILTSIGQGYVLATPLQLCQMTARLASGRMVEPCFDTAVKNFPSLEINKEDLDLVLRGMSDVVNEGYGTAFASRSTLPNIKFAGKTGTSQVRRITKKDRELGLHKQWDWEFRDHAVFVGYTSIEDPRYAVSVIIEHGGSGSRVAAPIARDIMTDCERFL